MKNNLPDSSRVWIYQSNVEFTDQQCLYIDKTLSEFLNTWNYHGTDLSSAAEVLNKRFIVIFVDEKIQGAGGCSIDKSVALIKGIEAELGLDLMNRMNIAYKKDDVIVVEKMMDFHASVKLGDINEDTIVYNNLVETKGELISSWEVPLKDSWHKKLL